jgi:hypothetical protein
MTGRDLPAKLLDAGPPYTGHLKKPFHIGDLLPEVERAFHAAATEPVIGKSPALEAPCDVRRDLPDEGGPAHSAILQSSPPHLQQS